MRFVANVFDEPFHIVNVHAKTRAGPADDVLLNHDAAEIVRAKLERNLADFLSLRHPRTLDARKIIEINPAQCLCPQIFMRANRRRLQLRVLGLKRPADECGERCGLRVEG